MASTSVQKDVTDRKFYAWPALYSRQTSKAAIVLSVQLSFTHDISWLDILAYCKLLYRRTHAHSLWGRESVFTSQRSMCELLNTITTTPERDIHAWTVGSGEERELKWHTHTLSPAPPPPPLLLPPSFPTHSFQHVVGTLGNIHAASHQNF